MASLFHVIFVLLGLCCLEIKTCRVIFHCVFYVSVHVDPVDGFTHQYPFLLYAYVIYVQLVQHFSLGCCLYYYSFTFHGEYHQLSQFHFWITNIAVDSFCTSWLLLMGSHAIHILIACWRCSSSIVTDLVSSAVIQSGGYIHACMPFMEFIDMLILSVSLSLCFYVCVWTTSLLWTSMIQVCTVLLCCTDRMHSNILCSLCEYFYQQFAVYCHADFTGETVVKVTCSRPCNIPRASLYKVAIPGFQCWWGFGYEMLLPAVLHFLGCVHFLGPTFYPSFVEDLLQDLDVTHLFLGTATLAYYRMWWLHTFLWMSLLCHIGVDMCCAHIQLLLMMV